MSRTEPDPTREPEPPAGPPRWHAWAELALAFGPVLLVSAGVALLLRSLPAGMIVAGGMVWWDTGHGRSQPPGPGGGDGAAGGTTK